MRDGVNPQKTNPQLQSYPHHQVIIPVYIPNFEGYFQQALEVFDLCLESLYLTTRCHRVDITVISNGSDPKVVETLKSYFDKGWISQLILNEVNHGKIDAIMSVARGSHAKLITFSDADVLFKPGWIEAIEETFITFPECGQVSPFPSPGLAFRASATLLGAFIRRVIRFGNVVDENDFDAIVKMLNANRDPNTDFRDRQLFVKRDTTIACVGCGHFVTTIRREVIKTIPTQPSLKAILGNSEAIYIDTPPDKYGLWKLSTPKLYVYHMGNIPENWMYTEIENYRKLVNRNNQAEGYFPAISLPMVSRIPVGIRSKVARFLQLLMKHRNSR